MFRQVLVATDFSAHADSLLECIGEIPGMEEILLVHVITTTPPGGGIAFLRSSLPSPREAALARLEEKRQFLERMTGVPVSPRVIGTTDGDIAGAIIRLAHTENIPLIVMGGRGKGLLSGYILGSVSEEVIRRGRTDVLIMHFMNVQNPGGPGRLLKAIRKDA